MTTAYDGDLDSTYNPASDTPPTAWGDAIAANLKCFDSAEMETYTPVVSGASVSNLTLSGWHVTMGKTGLLIVHGIWGASASSSGDWLLSLPWTLASVYETWAVGMQVNSSGAPLQKIFLCNNGQDTSDATKASVLWVGPSGNHGWGPTSTSEGNQFFIQGVCEIA